jgi:hypothetical protein
VCEHESCGYDPLSADVSIDAFDDLRLSPHIHVTVLHKPFVDVRFSAPEKAYIDQLADLVHYTGMIFHSKDDPAHDLFAVEEWGFDIVKKDADALIQSGFLDTLVK